MPLPVSPDASDDAVAVAKSTAPAVGQARHPLDRLTNSSGGKAEDDAGNMVDGG